MTTATHTDAPQSRTRSYKGSEAVDTLLAYEVTYKRHRCTAAEWIAGCHVGPQIGMLRATAGWPIKAILEEPLRTLTRWRFSSQKRSRFHGVTWHKASGCWFVQIWHEGKCKPFGYFTDEWIAAGHANIVGRMLFGNDAKLNVM